MLRNDVVKSQVNKFNKLLNFISDCNYQSSYYFINNYNLQSITTLDEIEKYPFISKKDLLLAQKDLPPYSTFHLLDKKFYKRTHQTSGTLTKPIKWLDTENDWQWWKRCWTYIFKNLNLNIGDVAFFPFSFNFFIGFWAAFDAAQDFGLRVIAGGGQSSITKLNTIEEYKPNILFSTPSYCFRLMDVAKLNNINLSKLSISKIVLAGEPGGSINEIRNLLSDAWESEIYDHYGATEIGAMGYQCDKFSDGFHLNEDEFIFEVIDPQNQKVINSVEVGELVVTNLGRYGSPLIRYRTGDIVQIIHEKCECGSTHIRCKGGILGRKDDMIIIKGTNIYPSNIESIVRKFKEVNEFQVFVSRSIIQPKIVIRIESLNFNPILINKIKQEFKNILQLSVSVELVPYNTIPNSEGKQKRFFIIDET